MAALERTNIFMDMACLAIMIQKNIQCRSQLILKKDFHFFRTIRLFFDGDSEVEVEWWNSYQDRFL